MFLHTLIDSAVGPCAIDMLCANERGVRVIALLLLGVAGCSITLAPQASRIRTTETASDVASCVPLASLEARPPYWEPGDDLKQLKNDAVPLGADTIFITKRFLGPTTGLAYKCK